MLSGGTPRNANPHFPDFLSCSKEPWRSAFVTTGWLLCCHLALVTIGAVYGTEARKAVSIALPEGLERFTTREIPEFSWAQGMEFVEEVSSLENWAEEQSQNADAVLLHHQLKLFLGEPVGVPEAQREAFSVWFAKAVELLTQMRVRFLGQLRFSMRALSEGCRLLGPNSLGGAIDLTNKGIENKDPGLWEDAVLAPPFDHDGSCASPPLRQSPSSSS